MFESAAQFRWKPASGTPFSIPAWARYSRKIACSCVVCATAFAGTSL